MPRPKITAVTEEEWNASVTALLEEGREDLALQMLSRAADEATTIARFSELLDLFARLSMAHKRSEEGVRFHLRLLASLRLHEPVLEVTRSARLEGLAAPFLSAFEGWALSQREEWEAALDALLPALHAPFEALTLLEDMLTWRVRARALAALGQGGWREAYARARQHVQGRPLALVWLEEGATLGRQGAVLEALAAYARALPLLERDPYYRAFTLHNMGLVCLRACRFEEAEAYFQRVRQCGRGARALEARALCGEAAVRRALGEWERAEAAYRAAAHLEGDDDDRQQAWRGLGHTLRLAGKPLSALEWLMRATTAVPGERQAGRSWVFVDLAAAHAALGDEQAALTALERTGPLAGEDADRAVIVRAELARQAGNIEGALALLRPLPRHTLWAREEAHAFADLFALLGEARPAPLPRTGRPRVVVRAAGPLEVRVNGRVVPLAPTSLAGVLLVALLEAGGRASTGQLALAVSEREERRERYGKQAVSRLARELRRALGWAGSVQASAGAYALDPEAEWTYDVREAQTRGLPVEAFLSGVNLPWVLERETELRQKDASPLSASAD
ncbi:tetratricopeptide repeat protein [Deinococcus sp. YIM 77859]|uniref:tetratricopeptide repeat protein n=1 Tax=Deinococcus sp. YIM 77859 TaxID=1540221 RepID=UPI0006914B09|nr:tetratricopeptide repeat protein [Deinococcus sp. YIM 77859]